MTEDRPRSILGDTGGVSRAGILGFCGPLWLHKQSKACFLYTQWAAV
jgi:hypothetical protein